MQAKQLLNKYQQINSDTLKMNEAVNDLNTLSRWGFDEHGRRLEQRIREQLDNERRQAFDRQLTQTLAG
ncbi:MULTISPECIES: hypothetical protein [Oceanisphaera]|uniref:Uncharacterized protein n=1 Tax=Oceanisphaera ostreae TaxID=914151 RepID=A0ABW3KIT7_9GAMM